jgi:PAS domain S-box-containing protein
MTAPRLLSDTPPDVEHGLLAGLIEHSPAALLMYRADGRCALVNPAFVALFGDGPIDEYDLPPVARDLTLEQSIRRAMAGETSRLPCDWYELPRRGLSVGEVMRVAAEITVFPVAGLGAVGRGAVVCINDMTAERNLRSVADALELSRQQFRATFEQAAVGIAHVSPDGRWLNVNQRLCDIVGYSRQELLRLGFQDITHPDDLHADLALVQRLLAGEIATYSMEKRYLCKDGATIWAELTVSLVRDDARVPKYFISVVQDISPRRAAELAQGRALDAARLQLAD